MMHVANFRCAVEISDDEELALPAMYAVLHAKHAHVNSLPSCVLYIGGVVYDVVNV